jgi:hypothetical protein
LALPSARRVAAKPIDPYVLVRILATLARRQRS